ncbi:MAG: GatB/YqeY domain-containing protein [Pseudomonadota bacterium]|nr:GatB/YqeY domain-containing protein [Pseudomonadota bacterium]MEE3100701.1 GatB/YqeY domain-containing protein [Pseudomonadota bacterium]
MRDRIALALKEAAASDDATRQCTLRLICAAIQDREAVMARGDHAGALDDAEVIEILAKMIRQREDSVRRYEEAGRLELAEEERREAEVIREFMPRPLSDDELHQAVATAIAETKAKSLRDLGIVMGALKTRYSGRMDVCKAGAEVRNALG